MTQSAVSKQVAQLEEMLNISLFYRTSQRISLTPAGKAYYVEVLSILKHIETATTNLMSHNSNIETLNIISHPTFCARWLLPAMSGFGQTYPNIYLNIKEQVGPFFSEDYKVDIAFLYGDGIWSGMKSIKLFDENCVAVCHPNYLSHHLSITELRVGPELLDSCVLLHLSSRPSAWYEYFKQQSIHVDRTFVGPRFDTFYACISAALLGYGIALVPLRLVEPELRSGELVSAWDYMAKGRGAYYMSYPLSMESSHKVKVVQEWIAKYLRAAYQGEAPLGFIAESKLGKDG